MQSMSVHEFRIELDKRIMQAIQPFTGRPLTQEFITAIWAIASDETKNLNAQCDMFTPDAIDWIHSQYVNRVIKVNGQTIGELTTQTEAPHLKGISSLELSRLHTAFQNTVLERDIVSEIQDRTQNGTSEESTERSDQLPSN